MSKKERIVCGLDIGTTKTCMLLARVSKNQNLEVVGTGYALSSGLNKGNVVDIEAAAACVLKAADEAELKSGVSIDWVTLGHSGDHVQSFNCHGAISIVGKLNQVTPQDMLQVIRAAKAIPMPPGRDILHILPQEFFLDNRGGIQNPVGLTGSRLDVNVHVVRYRRRDNGHRRVLEKIGPPYLGSADRGRSFYARHCHGDADAY